MTPNDHRQISSEPLNGIAFLQGAFGALCGTVSAGIAASWSEIRSGYDGSLIGHDPVKVIFSVIGFTCLLVIAQCLRMRGKHSASWAFLGYGSWMVIPASFCVSILKQGDSPLGFSGVLGVLGLLFFAGGGLKAALNDKGKALPVWWLGSLLFPCILACIRAL